VQIPPAEHDVPHYCIMPLMPSMSMGNWKRGEHTDRRFSRALTRLMYLGRSSFAHARATPMGQRSSPARSQAARFTLAS
jgi:hypothetical protein